MARARITLFCRIERASRRHDHHAAASNHSTGGRTRTHCKRGSTRRPNVASFLYSFPSPLLPVRAKETPRLSSLRRLWFSLRAACELRETVRSPMSWGFCHLRPRPQLPLGLRFLQSDHHDAAPQSAVIDNAIAQLNLDGISESKRDLLQHLFMQNDKMVIFFPGSGNTRFSTPQTGCTIKGLCVIKEAPLSPFNWEFPFYRRPPSSGSR